jgi:hypothetical protein
MYNNMHREITNTSKTVLEKPKSYVGDVDVDSRIILKCNLQQQLTRILIEFYWPRVEEIGCESSNESTDFIKGLEITDHFLNTNSALCSSDYIVVPHNSVLKYDYSAVLL